MADKEKEIEFYSAAVHAWFGTRQEHDRSLLILSAGGIGLLVTLLSTVAIHSTAIVVLYILALVFFLVCLGTVLSIFKANATYLVAIVNNPDKKAEDKCLGVLDMIAIGSFSVAAALSSVIGIVTVLQRFN